jgi:hypothetical protein
VAVPQFGNQIRIDFDEEKTHVGLWYTVAMADGVAEAYDAGGNLLDSEVMLECGTRNRYLSLDAEGIDYVTVTHPLLGFNTIDDVEYRPIKYSSPTIGTQFICTPSSGTLPFDVTMRTDIMNLYDEQIRRIAARIDVQLGNGTSFTNWRGGYTNVAPQQRYTVQWSQEFPAASTVLGNNIFTLRAEDITPAPFNQPPYPASGHTLSRAVVVTTVAP